MQTVYGVWTDELHSLSEITDARCGAREVFLVASGAGIGSVRGSVIMTSVLSAQQRAQFDEDGYILVRQFFDAQQTQLLQSAIEQDPAIRSRFYSRGDTDGLSTKMALWNHPGDSVYGLAARCEKMVDTMEDLLGGEVYHYHSKITAKEPFEGGAWEWHQDYGYWYNNGCLFPYMASAMTALDECTRSNGCLQVLKGSHHLGRIDHGVLNGDQVGADLKRIEEAARQMDLVYCEMEPGDVLFFHCNTLHRSDQNRSPERRWTLISCFNAARNNPYLDHHHPRYTPLEKVPDSAIVAAGLKFASSADQESFMTQPEPPAEPLKRTPADS
jgi:ectoine hydroxylase-related dioxygenase (phytanoyl-CoA dioxygenase family)